MGGGSGGGGKGGRTSGGNGLNSVDDIRSALFKNIELTNKKINEYKEETKTAFNRSSISPKAFAIQREVRKLETEKSDLLSALRKAKGA